MVAVEHSARENGIMGPQDSVWDSIAQKKKKKPGKERVIPLRALTKSDAWTTSSCGYRGGRGKLHGGFSKAQVCILPSLIRGNPARRPVSRPQDHSQEALGAAPLPPNLIFQPNVPIQRPRQRQGDVSSRSAAPKRGRGGASHLAKGVQGRGLAFSGLRSMSSQ